AYASRLYGNGGLVAETVELYENSDVAERYGVATVPSIAVNGRLAFIGLPSDTVLMEIVERYSQQEVY
ncbi:MAG: glutaredoxin, partial [Thermoprotei archaeon]